MALGARIHVLLLPLLLLPLAAAEPDGERDALMNFYDQTSGSGWHNSSGWGSDDPVCKWYGVTCDKAGKVRVLALHSNNLVGHLSDPGLLAPLKHLEVLWLARNTLSGSLLVVTQLAALKELNVVGNQFSGELPAQIAQLEHLERLWVRENRLSGPVPDLESLSKLISFKGEQNEFCGQFPTWPMHRSWLRHALDLSGNPFLCPLPEHPVVHQSGATCQNNRQPQCP